MALEVRYIVFTVDEVRCAVVAFVQKQRLVASSDEVTGVEVVGPGDSPVAIVGLQGTPATKSVKLNDQHLTAALLLYCMDRRIPLPKQASKKVELSLNGLTLTVTTERDAGSPSVANQLISYGELASRATRKLGTIQEELARALARADYAESLVAKAEERAKRAEAARGRSSAAVTAVALVPGLRGQIGRWLVKFQQPQSNEWI
jgi:hypothetical protein